MLYWSTPLYFAVPSGVGTFSVFWNSTQRGGAVPLLDLMLKLRPSYALTSYGFRVLVVVPVGGGRTAAKEVPTPTYALVPV